MFSIDEITAATAGRTVGRCNGRVAGVSTDSRAITPVDLFVPLRGERFDGHDFIAPFAAAGGRVVLAEESWLAANSLPPTLCCIAVADTLRALGDLAAAHRRRFAIPLIGVTGSNGKTTTKEMLAAIMAVRGEGLKTSGNLNNLIGLPRMLLQLTPAHRWGVLEMGMSEFGEIDRLTEIVAPRIGIITNAYPAHLATLGSVAGVARAKGELFLRLPPGGRGVYNADDPLISRCPTPDGVERVGFGLHGAEVTASAVKSHGTEGQSFTLNLFGARAEVMLRAYGNHNIYNALAAAAAADGVGIGLDDIVAGLSTFTPYDKRFQLEDLGVIVLIDDSYNANPASVGAALLTLRELKGEKRGIAVLGDMLELGSECESAHRNVGQLAGTCVDRLYLYGEMARTTADAALEAGLPADEVLVADSREEIVADIIKDHLDGDFIMVKGSRGMRMDLVAGALRENFSSRDYTGGRG
jgi:UDP-N-acetylmuramoyl-tripeptide--D-alanyl-D-alanine ligase